MAPLAARAARSTPRTTWSRRRNVCVDAVVCVRPRMARAGRRTASPRRRRTGRLPLSLARGETSPAAAAPRAGPHDLVRGARLAAPRRARRRGRGARGSRTTSRRRTGAFPPRRAARRRSPGAAAPRGAPDVVGAARARGPRRDPRHGRPVRDERRRGAEPAPAPGLARVATSPPLGGIAAGY